MTVQVIAVIIKTNNDPDTDNDDDVVPESFDIKLCPITFCVTEFYYI